MTEKKLIFIFGGWVGHKMEVRDTLYLESLEKKGFVHYKARAECFTDILDAFNLLRNRQIVLASPTIKETALGCASFDFWTNKPIRDLKVLWDTEGRDLHRIIQTIKPIEMYDGKVDLSFWD